MARKKRERQKTKEIAIERITKLLEQADTLYPTNPSLAQRYGSHARKIAMKAQVAIPRKWKHRFCRKCKTLLYPGITGHVRVKKGERNRVILYCEVCGVGKSVLAFEKKKDKNQ
jgi:ribonuclease P protein subunit RPR2